VASAGNYTQRKKECAPGSKGITDVKRKPRDAGQRASLTQLLKQLESETARGENSISRKQAKRKSL